MRSKRALGNELLEAALSALTRALSDAGAPWMIIGGIAVIARGIRRFTTDLDVAVRGDATNIRSLTEALARHGIAPRVADAEAFARANLVLLMRHAPTGVDIDVSLAWSSFEHEALERAKVAPFGSVRAPMSTAADLVVFKAVAGRPRDMEDAIALLTLYPRLDLARIRDRIGTLAEMAGAPEIVDAFELVAARVRPRRRRKPAANARRRR